MVDKRTHTHYVCGRCGAGGVKLWREYNTFLCYTELLCRACAMTAAKKQILEHAKFGDWWLYRKTDQIASTYIPAVPSIKLVGPDWAIPEDCDFWGYSSVPRDMCDWWDSLKGNGLWTGQEMVEHVKRLG